MRKILLSIIGILLVVFSIFLAKRMIDSKTKPKPVTEKIIKTVFTDTVNNKTIPILIPAHGSLRAKRRLELYSEVQGIFKPRTILFKPGQVYNKGQILIDIDASEHYASVQSAKSNLYNDIAAIMPDLRFDYPKIYQKWQDYLVNFNMDKVTPKLPEMPSEKENYFITGRGIVSSYYTVKNLEQRLTKYRITAPFNGILIEALATEGSLVRSGQKLGEFIDPTIYEMEVALSKSYATLLKVGEEVTLNNLEHTETYMGTVARVNGSVNTATQTITAFIEVKNEDLKEGMYLEAKLNAKEEANAIEIDRSLMLDGDKLFVVKGDTLDVLDVNPVFYSETTVVLKDIPNGTVILAKPVPGAYAGMLVKSFSEKTTKADNI
ncbi:efflux RND transporter periplasmic adaptor subunit [Formosa sp. 4Alg 33]|uniref:efflux RND transporter periplasmic adaptor subunit n=1 Tax=Formosa sp. 4Alg 33 TaxID=3382189 RepID=UPI003D9C354B